MRWYRWMTTTMMLLLKRGVKNERCILSGNLIRLSCSCWSPDSWTFGIGKGFCPDFMSITVGSTSSGYISFVHHCSCSFCIAVAAVAIGELGWGWNHNFGPGWNPVLTFQFAYVGGMFDAKWFLWSLFKTWLQKKK